MDIASGPMVALPAYCSTAIPTLLPFIPNRCPDVPSVLTILPSLYLRKRDSRFPKKIFLNGFSCLPIMPNGGHYLPTVPPRSTHCCPSFPIGAQTCPVF